MTPELRADRILETIADAGWPLEPGPPENLHGLISEAIRSAVRDAIVVEREQRPAMKWSEAWPTEPGWYWHGASLAGWSTVEVVFVRGTIDGCLVGDRAREANHVEIARPRYAGVHEFCQIPFPDPTQ